MKLIYCLLLGSFLPAAAQTVHPAGASIVLLNWEAATTPDSLRVDVDGDQLPDIVFRRTENSPTGPGQVYQSFFTVVARSGAQLAADSSEYDSAHRFQAGEVVAHKLRWDSPFGSLYLDYLLLGNGGIGGRGLFRDGQRGYVVLRKQASPTTWRYWWFSLATQAGGYRRLQVSFYGSTGGGNALATRPAIAPAAAFPNPSATGWHLPQPAAYQLFDSQGRLVGSCTTPAATIGAEGLAPGLYWLVLRQPGGTGPRQRLVKQ